MDSDLCNRLDMLAAVDQELNARVDLLPPRADVQALRPHSEQLTELARPQIERDLAGELAPVVLTDKGWRGVRPVHVLSLVDQIAYRALVNLIAQELPGSVVGRRPHAEFATAAIVRGTRYVSKTDVVSYYEFVDHESLRYELIAQTGEEPAVDALTTLLGKITGRRIGLPQVNTASHILGDTYIDIARRRLARRGLSVATYSDDFRIASASWPEARNALDACAEEVRALGLVLNDRKTFTYGVARYRKSLTAFRDAEKALFRRDEDKGDRSNPDPFTLGTGGEDYEDEPDEPEEPGSIGARPLDRGIEDDEASQEDFALDEQPNDQQIAAAERAWEIWINEDETEDAQAAQAAAVTQSLVGRALPVLGLSGDLRPLEDFSLLLRYEPILAPQLATYLRALGRHGFETRELIRGTLNEVVTRGAFSSWQAMWLAYAAGDLRRTKTEQPYERWLARSAARSTHEGLAATAAASLGRLGRNKSDDVLAALNHVSAPWRRQVLWALVGLDPKRANEVAEDGIDRLVIEAASS